MGFLDKAKAAAQDAAKKGKELADQAQAKIDEKQGQFNASQQPDASSQPTVVEYDKHGRAVEPGPLVQAAEATAPSGADSVTHLPGPPESLDESFGHDKPGPAAPSDDSGLTSGDPLAG